MTQSDVPNCAVYFVVLRLMHRSYATGEDAAVDVYDLHHHNSTMPGATQLHTLLYTCYPELSSTYVPIEHEWNSRLKREIGTFKWLTDIRATKRSLPNTPPSDKSDLAMYIECLRSSRFDEDLYTGLVELCDNMIYHPSTSNARDLHRKVQSLKHEPLHYLSKYFLGMSCGVHSSGPGTVRVRRALIVPKLEPQTEVQEEEVRPQLSTRLQTPIQHIRCKYVEPVSVITTPCGSGLPSVFMNCDLTDENDDTDDDQEYWAGYQLTAVYWRKSLKGRPRNNEHQKASQEHR